MAANKQLTLFPKLLTEREVANRLRITVSTLQRWRVEGSPIPFHKIGATVRYKETDVFRYLDTTTRDAAAGDGNKGLGDHRPHAARSRR